MRTAVESIIYFYLFICVALLVFNLLYIFRSVLMERSRETRIRRWEQRLAPLSPDSEIPKRLAASLRRTENLIAFHTVLSRRLEGNPEAARGFVRNNQQMLRTLAMEYGKKQAMERAYFAYVVASFHAPSGQSHDQLAEILLHYFDNSTVFCRENILQALYALGSEQALEHALEIIQTHGWYHSPKLIADGMVKFTGDRESLAHRLWDRRAQWRECLLVGVIQYITALPGEGFGAAFLTALTEETLDTEARFALVRYFQRHPYEPARPVLLKMLEEHTEEDNQLAIAAASALQSYEGEEVRKALLRGLESRNWYVRHNAAASLNHLGIRPEEIEAIRAGGDRYALEMLEYATGLPLTEAGREKEAVC